MKILWFRQAEMKIFMFFVGSEIRKPASRFRQSDQTGGSDILILKKSIKKPKKFTQPELKCTKNH